VLLAFDNDEFLEYRYFTLKYKYISKR
jgi:hypothetical protein